MMGRDWSETNTPIIESRTLLVPKYIGPLVRPGLKPAGIVVRLLGCKWAAYRYEDCDPNKPVPLAVDIENEDDARLEVVKEACK